MVGGGGVLLDDEGAGADAADRELLVGLRFHRLYRPPPATRRRRAPPPQHQTHPPPPPRAPLRRLDLSAQSKAAASIPDPTHATSSGSGSGSAVQSGQAEKILSAIHA